MRKIKIITMFENSVRHFIVFFAQMMQCWNIFRA